MAAVNRYFDFTKVFTAFCDDTRLKVLELLRCEEMCASELHEQIGIKQSALSHHMKILEMSGIVSSRKIGKWTYYSICESGRQYAAQLLQRLTASLESEREESIGLKSNHFTERTISTMHSFTILTDTSCDLPPEYMAEHSIESIPITFTLDGKEHNEGYWQGVSYKQFYDTLRNGGIAKTSLINPGVYSEVFTEYAKQKRDLLVIILSSGLSGTYQSAMTAMQEVKDSYPDCNIHLVDSLSASVGVGLLVTLAVKKREEGLSAGETAAWLEDKKHSCSALFTVNDLMYLHRGGRLSKLSAVAGSILTIKPILNIAPDGTLKLKDKIRGRGAALKLLVNQLKRSILPNAGIETVLISHTDCEEDAGILAEMVREAIDVRHLTVMVMGPVIGAHVGPGAIALVFESCMTRDEYESKFYNGK